MPGMAMMRPPVSMPSRGRLHLFRWLGGRLENRGLLLLAFLQILPVLEDASRALGKAHPELHTKHQGAVRVPIIANP